MITVNSNGAAAYKIFAARLDWCADMLVHQQYTITVGHSTAMHIRNNIYPDDVFTFNNADDAVAFKLKFGL